MARPVDNNDYVEILIEKGVKIQEAPIHENLKKALVQASELDTRIVMRSVGASHRVWSNAAVEKSLELEVANADPMEVLTVALR